MQRYFVLYCPNEIDCVAWTAQATIPPYIKTVSGIAVLPLGKSPKDYKGQRREHTSNGTPTNPSNPPSPTPYPPLAAIPGQGFGPVGGPSSPPVDEGDYTFSCVYPITVTLNGGEPIFEGFPVDKRRQGRVRFADMFVEVDEQLPLNSTITVCQSYAYLRPEDPDDYYHEDVSIPLPFPYGKILDDLPLVKVGHFLIKPVTGVEIIVRYEA